MRLKITPRFNFIGIVIAQTRAAIQAPTQFYSPTLLIILTITAQFDFIVTVIVTLRHRAYIQAPTKLYAPTP